MLQKQALSPRGRLLISLPCFCFCETGLSLNLEPTDSAGLARELQRLALLSIDGIGGYRGKQSYQASHVDTGI